MIVLVDYIGFYLCFYIFYEEWLLIWKEDGMNFVVGGSGVKDNLGFMKI